MTLHTPLAQLLMNHFINRTYRLSFGRIILGSNANPLLDVLIVLYNDFVASHLMIDNYRISILHCWAIAMHFEANEYFLLQIYGTIGSRTVAH